MTTYNKAFEDGMAYERKRVMNILEEAVIIAENTVPKNKIAKHERRGGLELVALLMMRVDGYSPKQAAEALKKAIDKEVKKKEKK